tara:strand:+ start:478 stop:657 length:180 start_codon:yes stop_codon:yes gene_type:complete
VEAPNVEAVHSYYEGSYYADEFHAGDEGGWTFHEVEELPDSTSYPTTDIEIDASGEECK